jgi:hypothetical protein
MLYAVYVFEFIVLMLSFYFVEKVNTFDLKYQSYNVIKLYRRKQETLTNKRLINLTHLSVVGF